AEWEQHDKTKPGHKIEKLILSSHCSSPLAGNESAATLMWLFFHQTYCMPIRVADHESFFEAKLSLGILRNRHYLRGDKLRSGVAQSIARCADVFANDARLPMPKIVRFGVGGHRPAARRRLVIQELDMRRGKLRQHRGHQAGDVEQA